MNFETFFSSFRVLDRRHCAGVFRYRNVFHLTGKFLFEFLKCAIQGSERVRWNEKNLRYYQMFENHDTDDHFPYFTPSMSDLAIDLKGEIRCWSLDLVQACQKIGPWRCGHILWSGEFLSCGQHNIGSRSISELVNSLSIITVVVFT